MAARRLLRLQVSTAPEPRILVVDIDEESLARSAPGPGRASAWPTWSRSCWPLPGARRRARHRAAEPTGSVGDMRLALLARHGPVVPAQVSTFRTTAPQPIRDGVLGGAVAGYRGGVPATGFIANYPALAAAPHVGAIGFIPDADGSLRRLPLVTAFEGRPIRRSRWRWPTAAPAASRWRSSRYRGGLTRVDFRRDWNAYTVVSASDILDNAIDPGQRRRPPGAGRLLIAGHRATGSPRRWGQPPRRGGACGHAVRPCSTARPAWRRAVAGPPGWPARSRC
jgi:adenylate cyclase